MVAFIKKLTLADLANSADLKKSAISPKSAREKNKKGLYFSV